MQGSEQPRNGRAADRSSKWLALLPWHEPTRQAATIGWWGWFPNIPRNWFGRVCWVLAVGAVSLGFGALAVALLVDVFSRGEAASSVLSLLFGCVVLPAGSLLFAWHLVNGIALARREGSRKRTLQTEVAGAAARVEEARRRARGQG